MRFATIVLAVFLAPSSDAHAILVAVGDGDFNQPAALTIGAASGSALRLNLDLVNDGSDAVELSSAQVALSIRPLPGSSEGLSVTLAQGGSPLFGSMLLDGATNVDGVTTPQALSFLTPALLGPMSRATLAEVDLQVEPGASGRFELVALDFVPPGLMQTSSEWSAPAIPPAFPIAVPFENRTPASGGGILLGVVTVVPEPCCMLLIVAGACGLLLGKGRSGCRAGGSWQIG